MNSDFCDGTIHLDEPCKIQKSIDRAELLLSLAEEKLRLLSEAKAALVTDICGDGQSIVGSSDICEEIEAARHLIYRMQERLGDLLERLRYTMFVLNGRRV